MAVFLDTNQGITGEGLLIALIGALWHALGDPAGWLARLGAPRVAPPPAPAA